jgi:hypothetical protein
MIELGKYTAIISLVFGTVILIHFGITLDRGDIEIGLEYLTYAYYFNFLFLFLFIIFWILNSRNKNDYLKTFLMLISNIPVSLICIVIGASLDEISIVNCKNEYKETIYEVEIRHSDNIELWQQILPNSSMSKRFRANDEFITISYIYKDKKYLDTLSYSYSGSGENINYVMSESTQPTKYSHFFNKNNNGNK